LSSWKRIDKVTFLISVAKVILVIFGKASAVI
jgi:hypothetical protein